PGGAARADRLRGRARDPEYDPAAAAARLPAGRVPVGARVPGLRRPPARAARDAGAADGAARSARPLTARSARYTDLLARLERARTLGVELGLERMRLALARLGDPQRRFAAVQIAGTNGKGSTAAMAEAILRAAGVRTGLFTSPHLSRFTERIRVGEREA